MSDKLVSIVTPVGELWHVNITGKGKENFNEDGYDYVATVRLEGEKAATLRNKIGEILGTLGKGEIQKSVGYRQMLKDAEGLYTPTTKTVDRDAKAEKTDIWAFTFKTQTSFPDGKPKKVTVYDTVPKKVDLGDKLIGNQSIGAISGKGERFKNEKTGEVGVSLYLNAIQLTTFIPYEGDAGFAAQEGTLLHLQMLRLALLVVLTTLPLRHQLKKLYVLACSLCIGFIGQFS